MHTFDCAVKDGNRELIYKHIYEYSINLKRERDIHSPWKGCRRFPTMCCCGRCCAAVGSLDCGGALVCWSEVGQPGLLALLLRCCTAAAAAAAAAVAADLER